MRIWTACALVCFCILCFEISQWTEGHKNGRLTRVYTSHAQLARPLLFLRTHRSDSKEARVAFPITGIILPMLPHTALRQTISLMESLLFFSQDSNLRFYLGVGAEQDATQIFNAFHIFTFDDMSGAVFGNINHRYVEVVVLRISNSQNGHIQMHALLAKAWSEINDFVLVVHGSCMVNTAWSLRDVAKRGNGYSMVAVTDLTNDLPNFELQIAKNFDHIYFQSRSQKIKCTDRIVQPLHISP